MLRATLLFAFMVVISAFGTPEVFAQYSCGSHCGILRPPNNLGLAGYWSFNEATSTVATDFSGNGNHATFGAGSAAPTWVSGKRGQALSFDNDDDYVEAPQSTSLNITGTLTIAFWVKRNSLGNFENWVGKGVGASDKIQYFVAGYGDEYYFQLCSDADAACTGAHLRRTTDANMQLGVWHHVAVTYDDAGNSIAMYLDGVARSEEDFIGSAETNSIISTTHPLRIGELYSADVPNATIDEVRIYNRVLDTTEIAHLAGAGSARSGAARIISSTKTLTNDTPLGAANGLVGLWTMDGGDFGAAVYDGSGNNNIGYVYNNATTSVKTIGKLGQAVVLDGTNDYVDVGSAAVLDNLTTMTVCAWVFTTGYDAGGYNGIVDKSSNGSNGWGLYLLNSPGFGFLSSTGEGKENFDIGSLHLNTWNHLCGTSDGTDAPAGVALYLNGTVVTGSGGDLGTFNDASFTVKIGAIGSGGSQDFYHNGKIDDVRIYNRVLSATEIKQLYRLGQIKVVP